MAIVVLAVGALGCGGEIETGGGPAYAITQVVTAVVT